jgi:hypothetical protein
MSERLEEMVEELLIWTRFMARPALVESLGSVLKDPKHKLAYELTDGNRTQGEVGKQAGLDQTTVSDLWGRWRRLGLLNDTGKRPAKLISLADIGWDLKLKATR